MDPQDIDRQNGYRPGVGLLLIRDGNLLLGRGASFWNLFHFEKGQPVLEEHPDWKKTWDLPQGGIELGETFEQALHREGHEELGDGWGFELTSRQPFRRAVMDFPVNKDGRTYRGKTYYFHTMEVHTLPEGYVDWVYGPNGDEEPYSYPTAGFPGGIKFMTHSNASDVVQRSRRDRKGQLMRNLLDELRYHRLIRA